MPIGPPYPGNVLAALRSVLCDVRVLVQKDPQDSRLRAVVKKLEAAEKELDGYAGESRPL